MIGRPRRAVVSVRQQDVLPVRVPVYVELDPLARRELLRKSHETLALRGVAGRGALVGLRAGVGGGAARHVPAVGPVAVHVCADAAAAAAGLAALAP